MNTPRRRKAMFSPIEKRAVHIILGMEGKQPKNIGELGMQLFPDVDPSAPSRDERVHKLREVLVRRSRPSEFSMYFFFYRKKRYGAQVKHKQLSPEDLTFLEEVYHQCPKWLIFRDRVCTVLDGSNLKTIVRVREE